MSVRFLGRRVYLSLAVVLLSARPAASSAAARVCATLAIPVRTLRRWQAWWTQTFPVTPLWQGACARFMPSVATAELPTSLIARFAGCAAESMHRILTFLTPLTVRQ